MTEKQILEAQARILHYELWNYSPKVEDFSPGLQYQRLGTCSKVKISDNCWCTSDPTWIDTEVEKYSMESPFFIKYLKGAIEERRLRVRRPVPTERLRDFLKYGTLEFSFDSFDVLVSREGHLSKHKYERMVRNEPPRPAMVHIKLKGEKYYVYENYLRPYWPTDLFQKWFNKDAFSPIIRKDWRYLLGLDSLNPALNSPTNELYKYLKGFWIGDSIKLVGNSTEWFSQEIKKGVLHGIMHYHEWAKVREQREKKMKQETKTREYSRMPRKLKKAMKVEKPRVEKKYEGPRWSHKKADGEVSDYVQHWREVKQELHKQRILAEIEEIQRKAKKKVKRLSYAKQKQEENRNTMSKQAMVCVRNKETQEILRLKRIDAEKLVSDETHVYTNKASYKAYLNKQKDKPGLNNPVDLPRSLRRQKPPKAGHGGGYIQQVKSYEKDADGNDITEDVMRQKTHEVEFVYVPETRRIWAEDPQTGKVRRVKGISHDDFYEFTNNPKEQLTEVIPNVFKRYLYNINERIYYEYKRKLKKVLHTITHSTIKPSKDRPHGAKQRHPNRVRRPRFNK